MSTTHFKSTKSTFFTIIIAVTVIGLIVLSVTQLFYQNEDIRSIIFIQAICWLCIAFLLWTFFYTHYSIKDGYIYYRSGPINGKIEINQIHEIIVGEKFIGLLKPATGNNGLVIKYKRWDEIYISPNTNEKFVAELLKLNDSIKVIDLKTK